MNIGRIKRKYKFRRIKNKSEAAYHVPEYFFRLTGVQKVTESGIWYGENAAKLYKLEKDRERFEQMIEILVSMKVDFSILQQPLSDREYIIIYSQKTALQESMEWFARIEENLPLLGLKLEQRLDAYIRFWSELTGIKNGSAAGSYILEPMKWKESVSLSEFRWDNGCFLQEQMCMKIMAVRKINIERRKDVPWQKIMGEKGVVKASAFDVHWLSDDEVLQRLHDNYLGLDSVLPRLKHSNPLFYELLRQEKGKGDSARFCMMSVYFLVKAANPEEMRSNVEEMKERAKENGVIVEEMPLQYAIGMKETAYTLSMFAGGNYRQHRYQNLLSENDMRTMIEKRSNHHTSSTMDYVEEMRNLFFGDNSKTERGGKRIG